MWISLTNAFHNKTLTILMLWFWVKQVLKKLIGNLKICQIDTLTVWEKSPRAFKTVDCKEIMKESKNPCKNSMNNSKNIFQFWCLNAKFIGIVRIMDKLKSFCDKVLNSVRITKFGSLMWLIHFLFKKTNIKRQLDITNQL